MIFLKWTLEMKIRILSWAAKGLRCPDLEVKIQKGKKVHFLQMPNGTGKTTLIKLIKNTLGNSWKNIKEFKDNHSSNDYGSFLIELGVTDSDSGEDDKITFRVEFDFIAGTHKVFTTQNDTSERPGFTPTKNIKPFLSQDHIQTFLFRGDQLDDYFDDNKSTVRNTVDTFTGVSKINRLSEDLSLIFKNMMAGRISGSSSKLRARESKLDIRLQHITDAKEKAEKKLEDIMPRWTTLNSIIESRDDVTEDMNNELEKAQDAIDVCRNNINDTENNISGIIKNLYSISPVWKSKSELFLDSLEKAKLPGTSKGFFEDIANKDNCICGEEMTPKRSENIKKNATMFLGDEDVHIINSIKSINEEAINASNHDEYLEEVAKLKVHQKDIQILEDAFNDLKHSRDKNSSIADEIEEFNDLDSKKKQLDYAITGFKRNDDETAAVAKNKDPINLTSIWGINNALAIVGAKIAEKEGYESKLERLSSFQEILETATVSARQKILINLKDDVNKKIHASHQDTTFKLSSIDKSLNIGLQEGGSGGQQVTAVSCFALSVLERSGVEFPMVIDHPVTPLHFEARPAISKMLTKLCDQSICFIINTEKTGFVTKGQYSKDFHDHLNDSAGLYTIYRTDRGVSLPSEKPNKESISYQSTNGIVTNDEEFFINFSLNEESFLGEI